MVWTKSVCTWGGSGPTSCQQDWSAHNPLLELSL